MNSYEEVLKSLIGKRILLGLAAVTTREPHYYMGMLNSVTNDFIELTVEIGRFRKRYDTLFLNRKAFVISYITEMKK